MNIKAFFRNSFNSLLLVTSCTAPPIALAKQILIVGDSQHPPFSYLEKGKARGIYTEIVSEAINKMGEDAVKIRLYPWKRAIEMVKSGEAKAVFPPHFFPQERPFISQYSVPLMTEYSAVFCNTEALKKKGIELTGQLSWPEDLYRADFVLSRGVRMGGELFWRAVDAGKINAVEVNGPENAMRMLVDGKTDCHVNDKVTIAWYLKHLPTKSGQQRIHVVRMATVIAQEAGYLATSSYWSEAQSRDFILRFNQQILQMVSDGTVEEIIDRYIN